MSGSKVAIDSDMALVIDGRKLFPIGFTMPPPPDGKAPNGRNGIEELHDVGATFLRTGAVGRDWDDAMIEQERRWQDAAARYGMHCWVFLRELGAIAPGEAEKEATPPPTLRAPTSTPSATHPAPTPCCRTKRSVWLATTRSG